MHASVFTILSLAAAGAIASPFAAPLERRQTAPITLNFQGATASYSLTFTANGQLVPIDNPLSVSTVTSPDGADVFFRCGFRGVDGAAVTRSRNPDASVDIGPPQTLAFVSCIPDLAVCLPAFSDCQFALPGGGITLGRCCDGSFCAADKCRPFPTPAPTPTPSAS